MRLSRACLLVLLALAVLLSVDLASAQVTTVGADAATEQGDDVAHRTIRDESQDDVDGVDDGLDEPMEDEAEMDEEVLPDVDADVELPSAWGLALFPDHEGSPLFPVLPAGARTNCVVAFQNNDPTFIDTVILVVGYLQPAQVYSSVLQNFSVVRQARVVNPGETVSFRYSFTPHELLEPGDYNLVIGVYFRDSKTNTTAFLTAFNATVAVAEGTRADPRTILTYLTLLAIVAVVGYFLARRFGLSKLIASLRSSKTVQTRQQRQVEMGTSGTSYDPDYISAEHRSFREKLLKQSSGGRGASSSPKKKR